MSTQEIINAINNLTISDTGEHAAIEHLELLMNELKGNSDGHLACQALIFLLERHPDFEFGTPGEPVHTLEFYSGHYENFLTESLEKNPTIFTLWMLNRIINAETNQFLRKQYIDILLHSSTHPFASDNVKEEALDLYKFQTES